MPKWTKDQLDAIYLDNSNIIVSAGAGSGKTAVLSERVLEKLKKGINIDELLILTFTKAAAEEMKDRIRKKISEEPSLTNQLNKIDSAYITTFDAYALAIVKKYSHKLNVSKDISIIDNTIIEIQKMHFIDEVFEEFYQEKDKEFLKLIDDFCTKDDQKIKKYILDINAKLDMKYDKERYLKTYFDTYFNDTFIDNCLKEYEDLLVNKISLISEYLTLLEEYVDNDYYEKISKELNELLISTTYEHIKANKEISLPRLTKGCDEEAKEYKEKINKVIKEITALCTYEDKKEIKETIYKTKEYVQTIIKIIEKLDQKINHFKYTKDLYEFSDIAKMAIDVLKNNEEISLELKHSLKEILIDEYQDTNDLQETFISLIENNNVYMVGDIKQSIYRFRNANPLIFKTKYDSYAKNNGGLKIDLNKNFRSRSEVLNNINLIFNAIMDDKIGGADYKSSHQMQFGNASYDEEGKLDNDSNMEILNYLYDKESNYSKEEIEIFAIAKDIKEKISSGYMIFDAKRQIKRPLEYSDIVILMDRSTHFNLYKKIFEYQNIPLAVYQDETITGSEDLMIFKNILKLILSSTYNEDFKYAFLSINRSYLFNSDDNETFSYIVNKNYQDSPTLKVINKINYKELNLKELVEDIIDKFNIYEKTITVGDIDKHLKIYEYILQLADNLGNMGYTINEFYEYLSDLDEKSLEIKVPVIQKESGVKIMTIHKSKGLEYHLCYYSGLYAQFNISELKTPFMFDNEYQILTPVIDRGIRQTIYKDLAKQRYLQEEISEKIRLFYVALTRAKEKMILIAPLKEDSKYMDKVNDSTRLKYNSFLDILNSIKGNIIKYIRNIKIDELGLTKDYNFIKKINYQKKLEEVDEKIIIKPLNLTNNIIEEQHFSKIIHKVITKRDRENMDFGIKMHSILENIDFKNPDYSLLNEFEKQRVKEFLSLDILNDFINVYKEYEFVYIKDNIKYHGFIDLLLEYEDDFKIVDYKLKNISDEAYIEQLKGYKEYVESLTGKNVSVYLYSIIDASLEQIKF